LGSALEKRPKRSQFYLFSFRLGSDQLNAALNHSAQARIVALGDQAAGELILLISQ
jgi:hypothetical protein